MTKWACAAIVELGQSIESDLENGRWLAFLSRVRQPEEIYIRTLYALFVATEKELPHILSGAMPNGLSSLYERVNKVVFAGRGRLMVEQPGLTFGTFKAMDTLNDGAHVSFRAFLTVIGWQRNPENLPSPEKYRQHLLTYCKYLTHMHDMFAAGKQKADVLDGVRKLHTHPASWLFWLDALNISLNKTKPMSPNTSNACRGFRNVRRSSFGLGGTSGMTMRVMPTSLAAPRARVTSAPSSPASKMWQSAAIFETKEKKSGESGLL